MMDQTSRSEGSAGMAREGFVVYHELLNWLEPYGDAERGRLFTAMLKYSTTGEAPGLSGAERYIWPAVKDKLDRDKETYESKCQQLQANATKSKQKQADATKSTPTETETGTGTKLKQNSLTGESMHTHGEFCWVKLTDAQYAKLLEDLGQEELDRCIRYVDESAQATGNKNKWKDWTLVIRKCHRDRWGLDSDRPQAKAQNRAPVQAAACSARPVANPKDVRSLVDRI